MSINEPLTIRSYIDKNLPNLNWNILPQIFESEGVELTEEIERYLRETPKNTNWNVFNSVGSGATEVKKIILQLDSGTIVSSDFNSAQEIYEYCENHKYTYEDEYGGVRFSAQGIEVYHEYSEEPLQLSYSDFDNTWSVYYNGQDWSAIWGVHNNNNNYEYYYRISE